MILPKSRPLMVLLSTHSNPQSRHIKCIFRICLFALRTFARILSFPSRWQAYSSSLVLREAPVLSSRGRVDRTRPQIGGSQRIRSMCPPPARHQSALHRHVGKFCKQGLRGVRDSRGVELTGSCKPISVMLSIRASTFSESTEKEASLRSLFATYSNCTAVIGKQYHSTLCPAEGVECPEGAAPLRCQPLQ